MGIFDFFFIAECWQNQFAWKSFLEEEIFLIEKENKFLRILK